MKPLPLNKITNPLVFGILFAASCLFVSCSSSNDDPSPNNDPNNDPDQMMDDGTSDSAPNFELSALNGSTVKLSDFENKVVVLFFLGSSCSLCKAVAPSVESELYAAFNGNTEFALLGLDTWDGNNSALQSFKDLTDVTFPLLLKASGVAKNYETTYDRLVVIDKKGKIAHKGSRATTNDLATVKSKVEQLLDGM